MRRRNLSTFFMVDQWDLENRIGSGGLEFTGFLDLFAETKIPGIRAGLFCEDYTNLSMTGTFPKSKSSSRRI